MAFDSVFDSVLCPACGSTFDIEVQIKYGYCRCHTLRTGDSIAWYDPTGRVAPRSDLGDNVGGEVSVPAEPITPCSQCGVVPAAAAVLILDNRIQRISLTEESFSEPKQRSLPSSWFNYWSRRVPGSANEDRVEVSCRGTRWTIAIADGAGGTSGGASAAQLASSLASAHGADVSLDSGEWCRFLSELDHTIADERDAGETTLVVLQVTDGFVEGASVGDSRSCLIAESAIVDLTRNQRRKPLLGTGAAVPTAVARQRLSGRLVVATDGLFNYLDLSRLAVLTRSSPLRSALDSLVEAVRLPGGTFQDDIALVVGEWSNRDDG
jgi:serine/threonine protein phosphatase PrpC